MGTWISKSIQQEIVDRYLAGESSVALSRSMGIAINTVLRAVRRAGITPSEVAGARPRAAQKLFPETVSEIVALYAEGQSLRQIAERFGVTIQTARTALLKSGVNRRKRGATFREISDQTQVEILRAWNGGASQTKIAEDFDLTRANVARVLRAQGSAVHQRRASGARHGNWSGGVGKTGGYLTRLVPADDPMLVMANIDGYVLEHRIVMARAIGRPLHHWETVHHIDGNKLNNELSNLQLRIGKHGKGEVYECSICGSRNIRPVALD